MSGDKKCPICGKPVTAENSPFCSKRCLNVDLSRWFSGSYAVPICEDDAKPEENNDQ